ncbi:MAG: ABC transporter ATP-binding protein/permease [Firmicutes bacterium]|nr:ABC transporter ATP-binding protein/permease [Bacillota bacterium]
MKYKNKTTTCLSVIKNGKAASWVFLLCKFLMGLLLPFTAYAYQKLIDDIIGAYSNKIGIEFFITSLLFVIGIYVFQAVEEPIENYSAFLIRQRVNYSFDKQITNKLKDTKYSYFENSEDLDLINRIESASGNSAVDLFVNVINFLSGIIKIVGVLFLLTTYSYIITVIAILIAVPIFWIASKYGKFIHEWYQKNSKSRRFLDYLSSLFTDKNTSFEIKTYDCFSHLKMKWKTQFEDLRKKDFRIQMKAWKNTIISGFFLNIFEYVTYAIMLIPAISGDITIGAFVGLSKAIASIEGLILWNFGAIFTFFSNNKEYWKEYNTLMNFDEVKKSSDEEEINLNIDCISIEFNDVYFRYANMEHDILAGVSFKINPYELCGLVGINGAGKSTLTKLLIGLYKPDRGDIYINGKNTKKMSFNEQASYFGVTYQDFNKYNISVKDNIVIANQMESNIDKIESCLNNLAFDYAKLPNRIGTIVGRLFGDGIDISGGESQKLALARMLYSNASFYIMDEPTASLDPISEMQLYKQIESVLSQKTALLITHRLGATVFCSKILVLCEGKIVEVGTFNELMERGGIYAEMYNEQRQWYNQ